MSEPASKFLSKPPYMGKDESSSKLKSCFLFLSMKDIMLVIKIVRHEYHRDAGNVAVLVILQQYGRQRGRHQLEKKKVKIHILEVHV